MIHNSTISNVAAPELFRHTPFEHETTTDAWSLFTTIQPLVVTMLPQEHAGDEIVLIPSAPDPDDLFTQE